MVLFEDEKRKQQIKFKHLNLKKLTNNKTEKKSETILQNIPVSHTTTGRRS